MIFHLSIDADDPRHRRDVLAELLGGEAMPFPSVAVRQLVGACGATTRGSSMEVLSTRHAT